MTTSFRMIQAGFRVGRVNLTAEAGLELRGGVFPRGGAQGALRGVKHGERRRKNKAWV